jgi:hypothetical protein
LSAIALEIEACASASSLSVTVGTHFVRCPQQILSTPHGRPKPERWPRISRNGSPVTLGYRGNWIGDPWYHNIVMREMRWRLIVVAIWATWAYILSYKITWLSRDYSLAGLVILGQRVADQSKAAVEYCERACSSLQTNLQCWRRRYSEAKLSWQDSKCWLL